MSNFTIEQMQNMQKELHKKFGDDWLQLIPKNGHYSVLWLMGELGEVIDVIKKEGDEAIMQDQDVRAHMTEELCDVMMFFLDIMTCYDITPDEFESAYRKKHAYNLKRWE